MLLQVGICVRNILRCSAAPSPPVTTKTNDRVCPNIPIYVLPDSLHIAEGVRLVGAPLSLDSQIALSVTAWPPQRRRGTKFKDAAVILKRNPTCTGETCLLHACFSLAGIV